MSSRLGVGAPNTLKTWSEWQDLNLRPPRPERGALPDCATLRCQAGGSYSGDPDGPQGASPGPASTGRFAPRLAGRFADNPRRHTVCWAKLLIGAAAAGMVPALPDISSLGGA